MDMFASWRDAFACLLYALAMLGCTAGENSAPPSSSTEAVQAEVGLARGNGASLIADPNPIRICDYPQAGTTTLSWKTAEATLVEIRVGSPSGNLFGRRGADGSAATGNWVQDGLEFYLQDVSHGQPLTAEHTLATVKILVTDDGCP